MNFAEVSCSGFSEKFFFQKMFNNQEDFLNFRYIQNKKKLIYEISFKSYEGEK